MKKLSLSKQHDINFLLLVGPAILFVSLIFVYPLLFNLWFSFQSVSGLRPSEGFVGFKNYIEILRSGSSFINSLKVTFIFTVASISGQLILSMIVALAINRLNKLQTFFNTVLLIPWITTPVIKALMWGILLNFRWGIVNYVIGLMGIAPQQWLAEPNLALATIIIIEIWTSTPRTALIILAALKTVSPQLLEAAEVDGASAFKRFTKIIIPQIKPAVLVSLIFSTLQVIREFDVVYVLTGGGPGGATDVLSITLHKYYFDYWNTGAGSAGSIMFMVITLVISLIYIRNLQKED